MNEDWDWKTWAIFILGAIAVTAFALIVMAGVENKAKDCVARGGRWIEYAKDYYTCAEAR